jgi:hypothetical protein
MAGKSEEDLLNLDGLLSVTNSLGSDILGSDGANKSSSFPFSSKYGSNFALVLYNFVFIVSL